MTRFFIRSWFYTHLISLFAIALQPSTPAVILGRYSRNSALLLGIFLGLTPVVYGLTRWLEKRADSLNLSKGQWALIGVGVALGLMACWLPNVGVTSSYIIVRLCLSYVLLSVIVMALLRAQLPVWLERLSILAVIAVVGLMALATTRIPGLLWTDEGYMLTVSMGYTRTGLMTPLYWQPANVQSASLGYIGLATWFNLFGISFEIGRLYVFTVALVTLALVWLTLKNAYSASVAWAGVLLGGGAFLFHNTLRTDTGVALMLAMAFCLFTVAQSRKHPAWHVLVGLAVAWSMDGHPNAYRFSLGFGLAYIIEYALQLKARRRFFIYWPIIGLMIGGVVGVGSYYWFYASQSAYFAQVAQSAGFAFAWDKVGEILLEQFNVALRMTPLLLGGAVIGVIIAGRRRSALDRLLLSVLFVSLFSIALLYGYSRTYYMIHNIVPMLLLTGGALWHLQQQTSRVVLAGVNIALVGASLALIVSALNVNQGYNGILKFADRIREVVPQEMVFVGVDPLYIRMYDYPNFVDMTGPSWASLYSDLTEPEVWTQLSPEAVAVVRDYPIPPFDTMLTYIEDNGLQRVHCWTDDQIGQVDLYMKTGDALPENACSPVDEE